MGHLCIYKTQYIPQIWLLGFHNGLYIAHDYMMYIYTYLYIKVGIMIYIKEFISVAETYAYFSFTEEPINPNETSITEYFTVECIINAQVGVCS